jgi:hypothetical protein
MKSTLETAGIEKDTAPHCTHTAMQRNGHPPAEIANAPNLSSLPAGPEPSAPVAAENGYDGGDIGDAPQRHHGGQHRGIASVRPIRCQS